MPDSHTQESTSCCICLEPLYGGEDNNSSASSSSPPGLAACAPCGHVFHLPCLESMMAFAVSQNRPCKCPMCNQPGVSLVKLFLDVPTVASSASAAAAAASLVDWHEDVRNGITPEKYRAWQQQAKQYKERWQNAKDNLSKQARKLQRHQLQVEDLERQLKQAAQDLENEHAVVERQQRLLECLRLEKVQAQRACETMQGQVDLAQEETSQAQARLSDVQKSFDAAIANASAQSLHEVRHILEAYPKVQHENQRLRALLQKVTSKNSTSSASTGKSRSRVVSDKARRHKQLLADLGHQNDDLRLKKLPKLPKRSNNTTDQSSIPNSETASLTTAAAASASAAVRLPQGALGKRKMSSSSDAIDDLLGQPEPRTLQKTLLLGLKTTTTQQSSGTAASKKPRIRYEPIPRTHKPRQR